MGQKFSGLEKRVILVVEDVEMNQYLARHIMESWGCIVDIAEDGRKAVDKVRSQDYDLVLMDIQMPVMDGLEATRRIRELENSHKSSVPIVALTANSAQNECRMYLEVGMNDCLSKPYEEPALFAKVSRHIRKTGRTVPPLNNEKITTMEAKQTVAEVPLYNLELVESLSGGDAAFVRKMLQLFLDTVPGSLKEMQSTCAKKDWESLSKQAHKLKSTIDSMDIAAIKEDIRRIEQRGKSGQQVEEIPALLERIVSVIEGVMKQVKRDHGL